MPDALQQIRWDDFENRKDDPNWWNDREGEADALNEDLGEYLEGTWFGDAIGALDSVSYSTMGSQVLSRPGPAGGILEIRGGAPLKGDLVGKTTGAAVWQAFAEIIDNLLDNYVLTLDDIRDVRGVDAAADLKVEIRFANINPEADRNKNGEIQIEENSGGVPPERRNALVQSGNSKWEDVGESVGVWGNGSKVALLKLGRWNIIQTYPIKGEGVNDPYPVQLQFGGELDWLDDGGMDDQVVNGRWSLEQNYYHPENAFWTVNERVATSGYCVIEGPGTTCINIRRIRSAVFTEITNDDLYLEMVNNLKQCYAKKISELQRNLDQNISIKILNPEAPTANLRDIELTEDVPGNFSGNWEKDRNLFAWIPGIKPEIHKIKLQIADKPPLNMEVRIGFPIENIDNDRGFSIWGNQRLFETNWCDVKASGRKGSHQWVDGNRVQEGRCRGMIFFTGDPRVIPWKGPVKWEFMPTHPYAQLVQDTLKWIVTKYTTASHWNLNNDNLLELFKRG